MGISIGIKISSQRRTSLNQNSFSLSKESSQSNNTTTMTVIDKSMQSIRATSMRTSEYAAVHVKFVLFLF